MEQLLGAQLYIFSRQYKLDKDIDVLLDGLASSGYHAVEGGPDDAIAYMYKLRQHNLRLCGHHTVTARLLDLPSAINYMRTLQVSDINISGPLRWFERRPEDYRQTANILNKAARVFQEEGIHLHYHNHDFEFEPIEGELTAMDILLDSLDFDVLDFCVDVGFVWLAGLDPLVFLRQHRDKIGYIHLRDFAGKTSTELGKGEMPLPALIEQIKAMPAVRQVVIEQDPVSANPFASMRESLRYLRNSM